MVSPETLVEKVARALAKTHGKNADWRRYEDEACVAIAAMRVPTQNMLEAAGDGMIDYSDINHDWSVMVEAALGQLGQSENRTPEN